jgi:hypothetical protein
MFPVIVLFTQVLVYNISIYLLQAMAIYNNLSKDNKTTSVKKTLSIKDHHDSTDISKEDKLYEKSPTRNPSSRDKPDD